jgi:hypothetical protein
MHLFPDRQLSEAEAFDCLTTNGRDPIELCFVLNGICRWHPQTGGFLCYLVDAPLARACRAYLRARGMAFETPEEFERHVLEHNWPNLEKLLPQIEFLKQYGKGR